MELDLKVTGDIGVVHVDALRIDAAVAIKFKDRMRELNETGPDRIVLDLGAVEFIDSSGLGAIVAAMKYQRDGQSLDLAGLQPAVDKVFRMTRMDTIFGIHASVEDALAVEAVS